MNDTRYINPQVVGVAKPLTVIYLVTSGVLSPTPLPLLTKEQLFNSVTVSFFAQWSVSMQCDLNALEDMTINMWSLDGSGSDIEHKSQTLATASGGGLTPATNFVNGMISSRTGLAMPFTTWNLFNTTGKLIYGFRWTFSTTGTIFGAFASPRFWIIPTGNS